MKSSLTSRVDAADVWTALGTEPCKLPFAAPAVDLGPFAGEAPELLNAPRKSSSKLVLGGFWGAAAGPRRELGGGEPAKNGSPLAMGCCREVGGGEAAEKGSRMEDPCW